jgi:predicted secreted protein
MIVSEAVRVHAVDGAPPEFFYEPGKLSGIAPLIAGLTGNGSNSGVYLKPGTSVAEISYYHNRPGFFYKNVTSTTDVIKKEMTVEAGKKYLLGFDRNNKTFTMEETSS